MAQFHAYELANGRVVLDLQTDLIETGSRVVAPLIPLSDGPTPLKRLEPIFKIDGKVHVLHAAELAAIPSILLPCNAVADLTEFDYEIRAALDMVFSGL